MKKVFVLAILCFAFLLAACTPGAGSLTDPSTYYVYDNGEKYAVGSFVQSTEEIDSINIDWIAGSVTLCGDENATGVSVRDDYAPKQGYEPYCVHTYVEKGTLYVKFMRFNLKISTSIPSKKLTVIVPTEYSYKKIALSTVTASTVVADLTCLDFTQNSGGIGAGVRTENCFYKAFFTDITAGDTVIKNCAFSEKTEFSMGTGSVIMEDSQTALLSGQCRTGDLVLKNCNVKKADVNISLNGDGYMTDLLTEDFDLSCAAGNIFVHLSDQMTDYKLDCRSPFSIVYPKDVPKDGARLIRLHSAAGHVKFLPKEDILGLFEPEPKQNKD